jgi:hypothetical protein
MSTKADQALEKVQHLYLVQTDLIRALEMDLSDPRARKDVREKMKEFDQLLNQVDYRYMGGEDVIEGLKSLSTEMVVKLKTTPVAAPKKRPSRERGNRR